MEHWWGAVLPELFQSWNPQGNAMFMTHRSRRLLAAQLTGGLRGSLSELEQIKAIGWRSLSLRTETSEMDTWRPDSCPGSGSNLPPRGHRELWPGLGVWTLGGASSTPLIPVQSSWRCGLI